MGTIIQEVIDGKLVGQTEGTQKKEEKKDGNFDKDMFLQLLVAEMKYQDPLEPTSNTEYVSELASFTQIEATQQVQDKMDDMQASSLVGKYVILDDDGDYVSGKVDYVEKKDDGYYLAVNDKLYSIDKLDTVADETYYQAIVTAQTFKDMMKAMPNIDNLTLDDEEKVTNARALFDSMTTYQKQFVEQADYLVLQGLEEKLKEMKGITEPAEEIPTDVPEENNEEGVKETE